MFISVVVPLYNKGKKVCKSINSVLSQCYSDFEIIVVDDGSTDDSSDYVMRYSDSRIKYIYQKNSGVSKARNIGISNANGDWLYFLDADDEIEIDAFDSFRKLHYMFPNEKYLVGQSKWMQNGLDVTVCKKKYAPYVSKTPYFDNWRNKYRTGIRNVLIHKSLIEEYGGFDVRMSFFEDWEFPLRLLRYGKVAVTSDIIGIYNQDAEGLSSANHPVEKEMAFYTPELLANASFWMKCLLYTNIEQTKIFWSNNKNVQALYDEMQKKCFSWKYSYMHDIRQRLINHNIL